MLLPVTLLPVTADWPHAELHVMSLSEAVEHSAQLRNQAVLHDTRWCAIAGAVAGAADAVGFAGTASEAVCVAHGHAAAGRSFAQNVLRVVPASVGQLRWRGGL